MVSTSSEFSVPPLDSELDGARRTSAACAFVARLKPMTCFKCWCGWGARLDSSIASLMYIVAR